jgi:hypothetical protein
LIFLACSSAVTILKTGHGGKQFEIGS